MLGCDSVTDSDLIMTDNITAETTHALSNANNSTEIVTESNVSDDWLPNVVGDDSGIIFSEDFGAPTGLGDAALLLFMEDDNQAHAELGTEVNVRLDEIGSLSYWTYQPAGNPDLAAVAYKMYITFDDGWTFLIHEPYWQNGTGGPPFYTIDDVLDLQPDAVVEFIQLGIGSNNPGWMVLADGMTFAGTTYDFDLADLDPASRMDCMDGGWEEFGFRNQGQCIRYVNTGQDSR